MKEVGASVNEEISGMPYVRVFDDHRVLSDAPAPEIAHEVGRVHLIEPGQDELELACRQQQVDDRCFANLADVPHRAITLTVPRVLSARRLFCVVPGRPKRRAVRGALIAPVCSQTTATLFGRSRGPARSR